MLFFYLLTRAKFKMASIHSLKKRKLPVIAVATKYNALKEIEGGKSQIETALTYKVSKSTITNWIKKKTQIYEEVENNRISQSRKRIKHATYQILDESMFKWFKTARENNVPINGNIFKEKAREFASRMQIEQFQGSDGLFFFLFFSC